VSYSTRRNLPVEVRLTATSIAGITLYGVDAEIANVDPVLVQVGATDVYTAIVTPTEWGMWSLVTDDGAGNITSTTEIECRPALPTESVWEALVPVWPTGITTGANPSTYCPMGGQATRAFVSSKFVAPNDVTVYGCTVWSGDLIDASTQMRFFAVGPTGYARGVSTDLLALTPTAGAWGTIGWVTVLFTKAVKMRAGDRCGLEITSATDEIGVQACNAACTSTQISFRNGALDLAGAMVFTDGAVVAPAMIAVQPLVWPRDFVVTGHSVMACHGANAEVPSLTVYELPVVNFDFTLKDYDLAIQLQRLTGRTGFNVADGGTSLWLWVAAGTLFATNVAPLHPRTVLYDSLCNESSIANLERLSILLSLCDSIDAELVLVEAPPVENFQIAGTAEAHNLRRCAVEEWCALNGVQLIPTCYALGEHSGSTELAVRRNQPKGVRAGSEYLTAGLSSYSSTDGTHLSDTGYIALANAIARGLRAERSTAKNAMLAAAYPSCKTTVVGDLVTYLGADGTNPISSVTVDGGTRGLRTVAVIP